ISAATDGGILPHGRVARAAADGGGVAAYGIEVSAADGGISSQNGIGVPYDHSPKRRVAIAASDYQVVQAGAAVVQRDVVVANNQIAVSVDGGRGNGFVKRVRGIPIRRPQTVDDVQIRTRDEHLAGRIHCDELSLLTESGDLSGLRIGGSLKSVNGVLQVA